MRSPIEMAKISEIMSHVSKLFDFYGENDDFFDEYVEDVLKHDLDKALICFRDLTNQLDYLPRPKDAKNVERLQGMQSKCANIQRPNKLQPINRRRT